MSQVSTDFLELSDACAQLCRNLVVCFCQERIALIHFKMDELLQNNAVKDQLLGELGKKRRELRQKLCLRFGTEDWDKVASLLENEIERDEWKLAQDRWLSAWQSLYRISEQNQHLLRHSLRNLECLADNLKRLLGLPSTYTAKGKRIDRKAQGGVVEGSY